MTTPAAARLYEAWHNVEMEGKRNAVYNPNNLPLEDLPVIYGFNNGGSVGWLNAELISEDGYWLGGHICSTESYMPHDLGILEGTCPDRHEEFQKQYPDGYRMEFVGYHEFKSHEKIKAAINKGAERAAAVEEANLHG